MTRAHPEPLLTERLTLRLITKADLPALLPFYSDPAYIRFLPNPLWTGIEDGERWLARIEPRQNACEVFQFVIEEKASAVVVGICLVFNFDDPGQRAEIGYALGPAFQGKGYAREAIRALLHYCFETLALRRIDAVMDPRNAASRKLAEQFGFVYEGRIRERTLMQGEIVDTDMFGLLRREWLALQR